jgi:hypothetical protein
MYSRIVLDPVLAYDAVYALVFVFEVVCAVFAAKHSRAVIWEECRCVSLVSFLHHNIPKQGENKAVKLFVLSGPSDGVNVFLCLSLSFSAHASESTAYLEVIRYMARFPETFERCNKV